jgi:exopolysaccharide biosynthesis polyprenyl glycosylphosphotransferase
VLTHAPELGHAVVGVVTDGTPDPDGTIAGAPVLGNLANSVDIVERTQVSTVLLATTALDFVTANKLARDLHDIGVHVELSAGLRDIAPERLTVRGLGRHALIYLEPTVREGWRGKAKRVFDVTAASSALLLAFLPLAVCAVLVKLTSKGPMLFRQTRVGQHGEHFRVLKLRTMVQDAEERLTVLRAQNEADGPLFKMRDDPRVTSVGRVLRKLSIDELPQLWNVVRGEMSLVGPRPALPSELPGWGPEVQNRLRVKPGMTGMWQVNGRSDSSFEEYVRLDLYYVDNWTLGTDLAILAKTIPVVLLGRGAS